MWRIIFFLFLTSIATPFFSTPAFASDHYAYCRSFGEDVETRVFTVDPSKVKFSQLGQAFARHRNRPADEVRCFEYATLADAENAQKETRGLIGKREDNWTFGAFSDPTQGAGPAVADEDVSKDAKQMADTTENAPEYGYCTFEWNDVVNHKDSKALISGVFPLQHTSDRAAANQAWANYVNANYKLTGFGECPFGAFKHSRDDVISDRDREQAHLQDIYENVIATGWLWHGESSNAAHPPVRRSAPGHPR